MNPHVEYWLCAAVLVLSMAGMGATLTGEEFLRLAKSPRQLLYVWFAQVVLSPLLALGVGQVFHLSTGLALGLLIVAALPGGAFSNLFTHLGRGNVALSVSCTMFSTLMSLMTTALVLRIFAAQQLPSDFELPVVRIISEVAAFLLGPLALGMIARRFNPVWSLRMSRRAIQGSLVLLAVFVGLALFSGQLRFLQHGLRAPVALIVFYIGALWLGYGFAMYFRDSARDSFAMGIEIALRNTGLGLLVKASLFPSGSSRSELGGEVLYVLLTYGAISLVVSALEVYLKLNRLGIVYLRCR